MPTRVEVSVLGAADARLDGSPVDLGTRKQRALLAALALHRARPVPTDTLVDLLWSDRPPAQWATTLQGYVAGLRRVLEPDRAARAQATVLVTEPAGYALHVEADGLDATRFDSLVGTCHQRIGAHAFVPAGPNGGHSPAQLEALLGDLDDALGLWRGVPYTELEDAPAAAAERVRLEELRLVALEDRAVASLALGRHATVAAELESLTTKYPLRERLWALRALALTRSGRQADALDVLSQVRRLLAEELGLEPGAELRELQAAVLRQDPGLGLDRPAPAPTPRTVATGPVSPWPMVGRDAELAALVTLLDEAEAGTPRFASVVGEPGIGKSRLLAELATVARDRGWRVLVGRCSQDEGAPPLWPWSAVLDGLDAAAPSSAEHTEDRADESAQFRVWDDIVRVVAEAAADTPLLVLLDDLHWADTSSLRVAGLLLESLTAGRLVLVTTWRDRPVPTGPLAAVAEQLSRRHGVRLGLTGLRTADVTEVVEAVSSHRPSRRQADALRARTEGNPFFLVEYARLVDEDADLAGLLAEPDPPHAVTDVLARRLERLPDDVRSALTAASVIGRSFDLATVVAASGRPEDDLLDALESAEAAGLVREDGVGRFRFAHALVRDTLYGGASRTRRARWHVRVAEALDGLPERAGEVARHWHAAGPGHAAQAWRADRVAAHEAMRVYAYEEARDLLRTALATVADDPAATGTNLLELQLELAQAYKAGGDWLSLRPLVHDLIAAADRMGDPEVLARVAVLTSTDALWQSAHHGEVDAFVVAALRRALDGLPREDSALRCRVMTGLAGELYYGSTVQERDALADEAVAMARRIGDPVLLMSTCQNAFVATWRPGTVHQRVALAQEALDIAERLGDRRALAYAQTVRAAVAGEAADVELLDRLVVEARRNAEAERSLYALVVLDTIEISWLSMRGEHERAGELLVHLQNTGTRMALAQLDQAVAGAFYATQLWTGGHDRILAAVDSLVDDGVLPLDASRLVLMVRAGRIDDARALFAAREPDLGGDTWFALLPWCLAAEASLALSEPGLASRAYGLLTPHAGMMGGAGTGVAIGPVNAFLAMAAKATGEDALAADHAERALAECRAWRIPLVEQWLLDQRDRYGF